MKTRRNSRPKRTVADRSDPIEESVPTTSTEPNFAEELIPSGKYFDAIHTYFHL